MIGLRIEMASYGPPEVLRAVEQPVAAPKPHEVIVRAAFAGVNRADCFIRSGEWPQAGPWPYVPGLETCGVVDAVGEAVTGFAPGDPVITMMQRLGGVHGARPGGYQSLVAVEASVLARVPATLTIAAAAAFGLPAVTAHLALEAAEVEPGQRVLVLGAASAVGLMAVQLVRARGAVAIGTGRRQQTFDAIRAAGADAVVSTREAWAKQLEPVDRVLDLVGQATFADAIDRLRPGGRYVFVGGTSGGELPLSGWSLMRPITLTGYSSETLVADQLASAMGELGRLVSANAITVPTAARYPLRDAARAHAELEAGQLTGRVLLEA